MAAGLFLRHFLGVLARVFAELQPRDGAGVHFVGPIREAQRALASIGARQARIAGDAGAAEGGFARESPYQQSDEKSAA